MRYERQEAREALHKRFDEVSQRRETNLKQIRQEAPAAEMLTSDARWNVFLQVLEGLKRQAEEACRSFEESLASPGVLDHGQMIELKMQIARMRERIDTIRQVMELPQEMIERGKKADELLAAS